MVSVLKEHSYEWKTQVKEKYGHSNRGNAMYQVLGRTEEELLDTTTWKSQLASGILSVLW